MIETPIEIQQGQTLRAGVPEKSPSPMRQRSEPKKRTGKKLVWTQTEDPAEVLAYIRCEITKELVKNEANQASAKVQNGRRRKDTFQTNMWRVVKSIPQLILKNNRFIKTLAKKAQKPDQVRRTWT